MMFFCSIAVASGFVMKEVALALLVGFALSLALSLLGAYACTHVIRMKKCLVWVGFTLLVFGCAVYYAHYSHVEGNDGKCLWVNCLQSANSTLSSFFPSRGGYEETLNGASLSVWYWLFHLLAMIYVTTIIVSVFGVNFCNRLWLKWRLSKCRRVFCGRAPMNVFWGDGLESEATAYGLAVKAGKTVSACDDVIFALPDRKKSWLGLRDDESVHNIARKRYRWIFATTDVPDDLAKADRHFFLGANGQENVALAERLVSNLRKKPVDARRVTVYIRISANAADDILYRWADKWNEVGDVVEVVVIREESLVSKRFLLENPMLKCPRIIRNPDSATVSGDFRILLVGFGAQGKVLMGDMICDAQCLKDSGERVPVKVDVFDKNASSFGWFKENCPDACSRYDIDFIRRNVHSAEFWREVRARITKESHYNRVVVCTRDDRTNISLANDIANLYRQIGVKSKGIVFARVRNKDVDNYLSTALGRDKEGKTLDGNENVPFTTFGRMTDTYSADVVVVDQWDRGAMWLNWKWRGEEERTREEVWRETSFFNKESSRASFFGQRKLLRLIGFDVDDRSTEIAYGKSCLTDKKLEKLAETEHLRWMAFHLVRGIKSWDASDETQWPVDENGKRKKVRANRITEINAHAALVDFAKLTDVDDLIWKGNGGEGMRGNLQQIDRDFVLSIVPAMKEAGFGVKVLPGDCRNPRGAEKGEDKDV